MEMKANIGIVDKNMQAVAQKLQVLLADEYVLYTKTLKFHWNIEGSGFGALHLFLKEQYEQIFDFVDDVAERIRIFGIKSNGTLSECLKNTRLSEQPGENLSDMNMLSLLLADHESIIRSLRIDIDAVAILGDAGTSNFLTDMIEKHEKMAWMLRAHVS
jgi:starvation-inducible DNA-binding protein